MIELKRKRGVILIDEEYDGPGSISVTTHGYASVSIHIGGGKYKREYLHRILMPGYAQVDHINGNRLDNRLVNLRGCDNQENNCNKGPNSKNRSGYKGVHKLPSGRWCAQITANYKCRSLGVFDTPEAAALAYNKAARELHGDFAYQNEIE